MVIRRVSPLSAAKIAGTLYALIGLLIGGIFSLIALAGGFASDSGSSAAFGAFFGVGAVILAPLFYGVMGFISALIMASLYNVLAGMVGGVEVEVQ